MNSKRNVIDQMLSWQLFSSPLTDLDTCDLTHQGVLYHSRQIVPYLCGQGG